MNLDFAQNKTKLRRIIDKMPNATEEELKAEYIKQGGLVIDVINTETTKETPKKTTVKEKVVKAVKKVTKK